MKLGGNVKSEFPAKVGRVILVFVFMGVLLAAARGVVRLVSSGDRVWRAREHLKEVKKEQERLKAELESAKSDFYREKAARDQLGLARPGETIIVLPDEDVLRRLSPRVLEDENRQPPEPNWRKWVKLFFEI